MVKITCLSPTYVGPQIPIGSSAPSGEGTKHWIRSTRDQPTRAGSNKPRWIEVAQRTAG